MSTVQMDEVEKLDESSWLSAVAPISLYLTLASVSHREIHSSQPRYVKYNDQCAIAIVTSLKEFL